MVRCLALIFLGSFATLVAVALVVCFLPRLLVVGHEPTSADAIVVLGGDSDCGRLRTGIALYENKTASVLLLTGLKKELWLKMADRSCPELRLVEKQPVFLENSTDTRSDAQVTLDYCRDNNQRTILVITSPYHSRRTQFIFNDIFQGSGIESSVISSGDYGNFIPPDGRWWADRKTLEYVWLEFGKILYWELTPFMEFQGEGTRLKESEMTR